MTTADRMWLVWLAVVALVVVGSALASMSLKGNYQMVISPSPTARTTLIPPVTTTPFGYIPGSSWSGSDLNPTNGSQR